jgi:hypothetical protein
MSAIAMNTNTMFHTVPETPRNPAALNVAFAMIGWVAVIVTLGLADITSPVQPAKLYVLPPCETWAGTLTVALEPLAHHPLPRPCRRRSLDGHEAGHEVRIGGEPTPGRIADPPAEH